MDLQRLSEGFVLLLLCTILICPISSAGLRIVSLSHSDHFRQGSGTNLHSFRRFKGSFFHFVNHQRTINEVEHLETNCELQQHASELVKHDLQGFTIEARDFNNVGQVQNENVLIKRPLGKTTDSHVQKYDFLHGSFHRHRAIAPFASSPVNLAYHDGGQLNIKAVSGEDDNSYPSWPLMQLRALFGFHIDERRRWLSHSLSAVAAPEPATTASSPSSAGAPVDNFQSPNGAPSGLPTNVPRELAPSLTSSPPYPSVPIAHPSQSSSVTLPTSIPNVPSNEKSEKTSGKSKAVIIAIVVTAVSTLALVGLIFYFYQKLTKNWHVLNDHKDDRPLLSSSINSASESMKVFKGRASGNYIPSDGGSKMLSLETVVFSDDTPYKSASSESGMVDGAQVFCFHGEKFRTLSLPSYLRENREIPEVHALPPLPRKPSSDLESPVKDTSPLTCKPSLHSSQGGVQNSCSSISKQHDSSLQQPSGEYLQAASTTLHNLSMNSSVAPAALCSHSSEQVAHCVLPSPSSPSKPPTTLLPPQPSPSPLQFRSPFPTPPAPKPPPPPPLGSTNGKTSLPAPPPLPARSSLSPSPPPPPLGSTNGKTSLPAPPPLPARISPSPLPHLPPRPPPPSLHYSNAGQSLPPFAPGSIGPVVPADRLNAIGKDGVQRPKLKPLHWDKVRANPDHSMVWDQIRAGSFQFNEEMIESLFGYNSTNTVQNERTRHAGLPPFGQSEFILDGKKSQNIAILLRALNVTREEICEALLEGDGLRTELLETLVKMVPTKEEEGKLKDYTGEISKLGPAERFLKAILDIPFAFKRFDAMLYKENFQEEVVYIKKSFEILEAACKEPRESRLFLKLLEAVLKTGNRMNVGTFRGGAQAFKLDTLLKLADVKGTDGKTTLLHFVVQEIVRAEGMRAARTAQLSQTATMSNIDGKVSNTESEDKSSEDKEDDYRRLGLQVLAHLSVDLCNVKKAAAIDSDALISSVSKLSRGLVKLSSFLQELEKHGSISQGNFHTSMTSFLHQAEEEINQMQNEEKRVFSLVKGITEYFHGDAAKEEAHPLRIFVIVRDFLRMLDQVCKEVGRMQKQNVPSSLQKGHYSVSAHNSSRSLFPIAFDRKADNSDDEST